MKAKITITSRSKRSWSSSKLLPLLRPRHAISLTTLAAWVVLGVDVEDVADGDNRATVGARLRVGGRRSLGGSSREEGPKT